MKKTTIPKKLLILNKEVIRVLKTSTLKHPVGGHDPSEDNGCTRIAGCTA
jgi:hypothetical protein